MGNNAQKISACLVVYNEEKIIERCLLSIKDLVDEIIVVHDGECSDKTLEIAREYTDKIFVREHIGEAEPHRAFAFSQTMGDWILQVDGDEYFDVVDHARIRDLVENCPAGVDGYIFKWEMWNGKRPVYFKGLQKMCLFRKKNFFYQAIPHEIGHVRGIAKKADVFLRHRPLYNNISWKSFLKKRARWVPVHARYFFPETTKIEYFNTTAENWVNRTKKIRSHMVYYVLFEPVKMLLGQMKNGLWTSWAGINAGLQQFVYYFTLYLRVWKTQREKKSG